MKKWSVQNTFAPDSLQGLKPYMGYYFIPLVRFYACNEPTTITIELRIPTVEKWKLDGMPNEAFYIGNFTAEQYRPFMKKYFYSQKGIEEFTNALRSALWYLEEWDVEVSKVYRELRGTGARFVIDI